MRVSHPGGAARRGRIASDQRPPFLVGHPCADEVSYGSARPGGNVTGLAGLQEGLPGKWVELLKESLPNISRVALLWDPAYGEASIVTAEAAAQRLKIRLQVIRVSRPEDLEAAFVEMRKNRAEVLIVLSSAFLYARMHVGRRSSRLRLGTGYRRCTASGSL
jgi:putative tryptophan/tyrosine transport system substrate-binding protein